MFILWGILIRWDAIMRLRLRYIYAISLICFTAFTYYLTSLILRTNVPIHVVTKLIYEPGHDIENPQHCHRRNLPKVLIGVISAPKNHIERSAIRRTWGNLSRQGGVVLAFFVGKSLDADVNRLVTKESLVHSDIVRSNNVDSYQNLTLKAITLLEWSLRHCTGVRFVMKCDDDVFVNITNLLSFVHMNRDSKMTIFGELGHGLGPLWWPLKWYVSSSEYNRPKYPDFLFGPAYLLSADCLQPLYTQSLKTEFFRLEDVFITGIIAESIGVKRVGSSLFTRRYYTPGTMNFNPLMETKIRISIHDVNPSEQAEFWNVVPKR